MKNKLSHQQRLLQKMSLTPQMRQSLRLLGLSVTDLNDYVESVLANNPFLKKISEGSKGQIYKKENKTSAAIEPLSQYADQAKDETNPRLALLSQLRMSGLDGKAYEIAEYLIYEMDGNGYITADPEEVAADLSVSSEDVLGVLGAIQRLDPPGIGAASMRECLELQLKRNGKEGSLEYAIVSSFLNEVAQDNIQKIAKELEVDKEKVRMAIANIKRLNPRPATTMLARPSERVIPDLVAKIKDEKIGLEVNRQSMPNLAIYNPYKNNLDIIKDPEAREFLKENMDFAKGLIDGLKRREETVCEVAKYILTEQREALTEKKKDLKTLTIKDVAKALDFHPSTISRSVSNKYIQLDDKVIELKSLLSHGIRKENGEVTSKASVKNRIAAIVAGEDKRRPLSDSVIKEMLKTDGVVIERRTIAKYRKALRLLPAYLRKKVKPS